MEDKLCLQLVFFLFCENDQKVLTLQMLAEEVKVILSADSSSYLK